MLAVTNTSKRLEGYSLLPLYNAALDIVIGAYPMYLGHMFAHCEIATSVE